MRLTLDEIARALGTSALGDGSLVVTGLSEPAAAGPDDLALAMSPRYAEGLARGRARAAVLWPGADWRALGLAAAVEVGRPRLAMADLTAAFDAGPGWPAGVHPSALVDPSARLGAAVTVGPFSVIGPAAEIGDGSRIGAHVSIGAGSRIGPRALIHPGVRIGPRVTAGAGLILHPNAVIGADGLSFVTADVSLVENVRRSLGDAGGAAAQDWRRIHSLGGVEIGDDVEIGACSAVDYGTIRATRIGDGVKIDNLVHIAHNVQIGSHCLLAAQAGIAGSTRMGSHCVMGGQSGVADNLTIGDRVIIGAAAKVLSNVAGDSAVMGYPAVKMQTHVEMYKALRRLPRMLGRLGGQKDVSKAGEND